MSGDEVARGEAQRQCGPGVRRHGGRSVRWLGQRRHAVAMIEDLVEDAWAATVKWGPRLSWIRKVRRNLNPHDPY